MPVKILKFLVSVGWETQWIVWEMAGGRRIEKGEACVNVGVAPTDGSELLPMWIWLMGKWKEVGLSTHPPTQDWTEAAAPSPCSPPGPYRTLQPHMTSPAYWPLEHTAQQTRSRVILTKTVLRHNPHTPTPSKSPLHHSAKPYWDRLWTPLWSL